MSKTHDLQKQQAEHRFQLWMTAIRCLGAAVIIVATYVPLQWLYLSTVELAGKRTDVSLNVTIAITIAGLAAVVRLFTLSYKMKGQREELIRLRERCSLLEGQLAATGVAVPKPTA